MRLKILYTVLFLSLHEIQLLHPVWLRAPPCASMRERFVLLSSAHASGPERHYCRPQWHHRVEFKNSRSSARFLSRCKQKRAKCQKSNHSQDTTATCWWRDGITCLSFFDFFTFIFIFFPEIMLYLPFVRSFKYWAKQWERKAELKKMNCELLAHCGQKRNWRNTNIWNVTVIRSRFGENDINETFLITQVREESVHPTGVVTLDICTGPEFSSPPFLFSLFFLRLCRLSFFPFCNEMSDIFQPIFQYLLIKFFSKPQVIKTWDKMQPVTFLCCFSFFRFLDCFLDLLRESETHQ